MSGNNFTASSDGLTYKRTSDRSYSESSGSNQITDVAPYNGLTQTVTLQDGITGTATSSAVNMSNFNKCTISFDMTTSHTTVIEGSNDGSTFINIGTDADGTDISAGITTDSIVKIDGKYKYLRVDTTAVSGALTVILFAGN